MNAGKAYAAGFEQAHRHFDVDDDGASLLAGDETFAAVAFLYHNANLYTRTPTTGDDIAAIIDDAAADLESALDRRGRQVLAEQGVR